MFLVIHCVIKLVRSNYMILHLDVNMNALFYLNKEEGDFNRFEYRVPSTMDLYRCSFEDQKEEKVLEEIKQLKTTKVSQTFAKMKPAASAQILSQMSADEAAEIMSTLNSKITGQILAKMEPKKGSEITAKLREIPESGK